MHSVQGALRDMLQQCSLTTERQDLFVTNVVAALQVGKFKGVQFQPSRSGSFAGYGRNVTNKIKCVRKAAGHCHHSA